MLWRRLLLLAFLFLLTAAAAPRPRTEVAVRVNTPALTIDHRQAMAQEVAQALNLPNVRVTVTMTDRVVGAGAQGSFEKFVPTAAVRSPKNLRAKS